MVILDWWWTKTAQNYFERVVSLMLHCFNLLTVQGGKSARIVNCVLAIKSYSEWKEGGGNGSWKPGANLKAPICVKSFVRKNSEPFMNSFSRASSLNEKSLQSLSGDLSSYNDIGHDINEAVSELWISVLFILIFTFHSSMTPKVFICALICRVPLVP